MAEPTRIRIRPDPPVRGSPLEVTYDFEGEAEIEVVIGVAFYPTEVLQVFRLGPGTKLTVDVPTDAEEVRIFQGRDGLLDDGEPRRVGWQTAAPVSFGPGSDRVYVLREPEAPYEAAYYDSGWSGPVEITPCAADSSVVDALQAHLWLRVALPDDLDHDTQDRVGDQIVRLASALSRLHELKGGSGLELKDGLAFEPSETQVEVP
ncbi:MAG: hypothetical protein AAF682_32070 [Planctomycetota bacterium]